MFKELPIDQLQLNPFTAFGTDWMALAAGNEVDGCNAMTIAWGHFGSLWERKSHANRLPTAICYVRPSRYTKEFMDKEKLFTLCAFAPEQKKVLGILGSRSGRDGDKIAAAGLTTMCVDGTVAFAEAKMVYVCRKLYHAPLLESGFADKELVDFNYPKRDFHEMYVGEVIKVLVNDFKPDNG